MATQPEYELNASYRDLAKGYLKEQSGKAIPLLETVYSRQITIMGTRGIAANRVPALIGMIAAGRIDPARLITKRISLAEAGAALAAMDGYTGAGVTVINRFG